MTGEGRLRDAFDPNAIRLPHRLRHVVVELEPGPDLRRAAERLREADRHLQGDAAALVDQLGEGDAGDAERLGCGGDPQADRTNRPGCGGVCIGMAGRS